MPERACSTDTALSRRSRVAPMAPDRRRATSTSRFSRSLRLRLTPSTEARNSVRTASARAFSASRPRRARCASTASASRSRRAARISLRNCSAIAIASAPLESASAASSRSRFISASCTRRASAARPSFTSRSSSSASIRARIASPSGPRAASSARSAAARASASPSRAASASRSARTAAADCSSAARSRRHASSAASELARAPGGRREGLPRRVRCGALLLGLAALRGQILLQRVRLRHGLGEILPEAIELRHAIPELVAEPVLTGERVLPLLLHLGPRGGEVDLQELLAQVGVVPLLAQAFKLRDAGAEPLALLLAAAELGAQRLDLCRRRRQLLARVLGRRALGLGLLLRPVEPAPQERGLALLLLQACLGGAEALPELGMRRAELADLRHLFDGAGLGRRGARLCVGRRGLRCA